MVGKGVDAPKSSRIFHQCYLKCCKLQNLTPLNSVVPSGNGKVIDFCVDRIRYQEWPPILNALSCDLSLHSIAMRSRQQVKTVLEHIDCERLAKTVNKRAVILTNFMLSNLVVAISQLLSNTTLLTSLLLEGLPMKIPYLNPLCEAILSNSSLKHIYLPRCLIGDAGCHAVCKAVRCLPNILTLDLSGCELTPIGAGYIADLVKYQKIHRYSENWVHTLRYRLPDLDTMAGLRRITLCGNPQLGDVGVCKLLEVLSDDLWMKALDVQNCGLTEQSAEAVIQMLQVNTTIVIIDMRHNADISTEALSKVRASLREKDRGMGGQWSWLQNSSATSSSDGRSLKSVKTNVIPKDRMASNTRNGATTKYNNKSTVVKKEKDYAEILGEQLQDEISHRQQLEELNLQLVDQMKQLKQQQIRLWSNGADTSSGSEQSLQDSSRSNELSMSSGSTSSVPIDQNTLSYIQQAFKDIYAFIKNNQCTGQCLHQHMNSERNDQSEANKDMDHIENDEELRANIIPKKAHSQHLKLTDVKMNKTTQSAHLLGDNTTRESSMEFKPDMIEKQMGDSKNVHDDEECIVEDFISTKTRKSTYEKISSCSSIVSESSETLVSSPLPSPSPPLVPALNPREALYSSSDEDEDDDDSS